MSQLSNITQITSTTSLSNSSTEYLINIGTTGPTGNIFLTLPLITTNGMYIEMTRIDTSNNNVIVQATGPNSIYQNLGITGNTGSGSSGNYLLYPQTNIIFESFNNDWYITNNTSTRRFDSKIIFSSAFTGTGGTPYLTYVGATLNPLRSVCSFPFNGTDVEYLTNIKTVVVSNVSTQATGTFYLRTSDGVTNLMTFGYTAGTGTDVRTITATSENIVNPLPTTPTILNFYIQVMGGSTKSVRLYSMTVS